MKFNTKDLKSNWKFLVIITIVIIIFLVISFFTDQEEAMLEEEILGSGDNKISQLVINEIQTNNNGSLMAEDGGTYDWIEIYNGNNRDVDLSNYSLSDDMNKIKWAFPNGTIIKSKEYLVIFLSGENVSGLYANFKLSSDGGEQLVLRNSHKKVVDAVDVVALTSGEVLARDMDGAWHIYSTLTPGFINTLEGYNEFLKSLEITGEKDLIINEVLPRNAGQVQDNYGMYSGFIELKNVSKKPINLSEYAISDDENKPFKFQLPEVLLGSGDIFLIWTSNKKSDDNTNYHATFRLEGENGNVLVTHKNKIVENIRYENLANGISLIKNDDKMIESTTISPGYENDSDGINKFLKTLKTSETLIISEAMPSNYSYMPHNGGSFYDWIELYNNSSKEINLQDYCLTKDETTCSDILPNVTLKKGEYYILMASGDKNLSIDEYKHLNFKIGDNDTIYLMKNKEIIDSLFVPKLDAGYSYGKGNDYGIYFYKDPTPKAKNGSGTVAISTPPTMDKVGGIYNNTEKIVVTLSGEGDIYWTTDGTIPTTSSHKYTEPIELTKTTVLKAISKNGDKRSSSVVTNSYIINENHTVPVMSVSIDPGDFNYVSSNAWELGVERKAYAEYFDGEDGFEIPCGFKLFGGSTRGYSKKSFTLKFRKQYGEGHLNYKVFDNRNYASFNSLVLRTASQDENRAFIRDILGTSLVDGVTEAHVLAYKTIILYINGKYWGIYFIREQTDETYVENNFNTSNPNTDILRIDNEIKAGNTNAWNELVSFINNHDLTKEENYKKLEEMIDIDSFIDFWIAELWTTNNDIVNYRYFRNPDVDGGRWKFIFYDLDWAFYNYSKNYYNFATDPGGMTVNGYSTFLLRNLMKSPQFRDRFVERMSYNYKNVWNKERVNKYMDDILKEIEPEIERNHERWNLSMDNYNSNLDRLREYIDKREGYLLRHTKSYFNLSDEEMKEYFGD